MANIVTDSNGNEIQGFSPSEAVSVASETAWTPDDDHRAFCVPSDCTYIINGAGSFMTLYSGAIRVIRRNTTYTFSTNMVLEVM